MENKEQLISFRALLSKIFYFLKTNYKQILLSFLPIELLVLITAIAYNFLPESDSLSVIIFALFLSIIIFLILTFKKIFILGYPVVIKDIEQGEKGLQYMKWYKEIFSKTIQIIWIGGLVLLINMVFMIFTLLVSILLFTLPTIIVAIFYRIGLSGVADILYDLLINNITIFVSGFIILILAFISNIIFMINSVFSMYSYIVDGRKGIDAITTSFILVSQFRKKIILRVIGIWFLAILPFIFFVFPIYIKIIIDFFGAIAIQVALLGLEPSIPRLPVGIAIFRDIMTSIASLISLPIFTVASYFLWHDVRSSSQNFEEINYNKTRVLIKRMVSVGITLLSIIVIISIVTIFLAI